MDIRFQGFTKGIWLYYYELIVSDNHSPTALVYMDTEGFGAIGNYESFDAKLCFLSTLFSSLFFYNVMNSIDMNNVKFLHTVANLEEIFHKDFKEKLPVPPVTWLVQNFDLIVSEPEDYLRQVFAEKEGDDIRVVKYNQINQYVHSKFAMQPPPNIFLLPHPSPGTIRRELTELNWKDCSTIYTSQIKTIRSTILKRIQTDGAKKDIWYSPF